MMTLCSLNHHSQVRLLVQVFEMSVTRRMSVDYCNWNVCQHAFIICDHVNRLPDFVGCTSFDAQIELTVVWPMFYVFA